MVRLASSLPVCRSNMQEDVALAEDCEAMDLIDKPDFWHSG